jgi:hypothetical protein
MLHHLFGDTEKNLENLLCLVIITQPITKVISYTPKAAFTDGSSVIKILTGLYLGRRTEWDRQIL